MGWHGSAGSSRDSAVADGGSRPRVFVSRIIPDEGLDAIRAACDLDLWEDPLPPPRDELLRRVGDGLYIGRIWYTYPINGLRAGDFTCTVVGDSFIIRDGRLAAPLKANTLRINDNVTRLLGAVLGTTKDARGMLVWGADEIVYAPAIAVSGVHVDAIAGFMEGLD